MVKSITGIIAAFVVLAAMALAQSAPTIEGDVEPLDNVIPIYGEYVGDNYIFTMNEDGLFIRYRYDTKWVILNDLLRVDFFDPENGEFVKTVRMVFAETDSTYEIRTKNYVYSMEKRDESTMAIQEGHSGE